MNYTTEQLLESLQSDLTTIKTNLSNAGMEISASDDFSSIATKTDGITIGGGGGYSGHYDAEGLAQMGWTTDDIQYYQDNGVLWDSANDNSYKVRADEINGTAGTNTRYISKSSSLTSFRSYYSLYALPYLNISKTDWSNTFRECYNLITIPLFNTSNATTMQTMLNGCSNLISIPLLDTGNVTTMQGTFQNCYNLKTIPLLNTGKVTNTSNMFSACYSLRSVPLIDTSKVTNANTMFNYCYALVDVPQFNMSSATSMSNLFGACMNLSNDSLNNIMAMCIGATSYTGTKSLTTLGIDSNRYSSRIQGLSNYQAFTNAGWTI